MGDNSMITVLDEAELSQAQFMGPNNEYALVKINKIEDIGNFSSQGNIHYEVKEIDDDITEDIWWEAKFLDAIKNTEGTISKWGESPSPFLPETVRAKATPRRVRLRNPYRPGLLYVRIRRQLPVGRRLRLQRCGLGRGDLLSPREKYEPHQAHTARRDPCCSRSKQAVGRRAPDYRNQ